MNSNAGSQPPKDDGRGPDSQPISPLQLGILRSLWRRGEATVLQVQEDLADTEDRGLAPTTVATLLSRLEKRELVTHRTAGRQFWYRALVAERDVTRSMVSDFAGQLFAGDMAGLVSHLIDEHDIAPGDLERLRRMLDARAAESPKGAK